MVFQYETDVFDEESRASLCDIVVSFDDPGEGQCAYFLISGFCCLRAPGGKRPTWPLLSSCLPGLLLTLGLRQQNGPSNVRRPDDSWRLRCISPLGEAT